MATKRSILVVVTSHSEIDPSTPTGLWFEEFSVPFTLFKKQGYSVTVASVQGGAAPIDPNSLEKYAATSQNEAAKAALSDTRRLSPELSATHYDAVFFPGGHGTMFDLPHSPDVRRLVVECLAQNKVLAAVCHGPACFVGAQLKNGASAVKGRKITAFTDAEERAVQLSDQMPFLLESKLRELGAQFNGSENFESNIVVDGQLITGQNPASSAAVARAVIDSLER